jgi:hypothetical protein
MGATEQEVKMASPMSIEAASALPFRRLSTSPPKGPFFLAYVHHNLYIVLGLWPSWFFLHVL